MGGWQYSFGWEGKQGGIGILAEAASWRVPSRRGQPRQGKSEGEHRDGRLALGAAVRQRHALSQNPGRTEVGRWQLPCTGGGLARQDCGQVHDQKTGGVRGGRGRG